MIGNSIPVIYCDGNHFNNGARIQIIAECVADKLLPLVPGAANIITFDGFDGVGKSTLAQPLAKVLGLPLIGLDRFLESDQDKYLDALKLDELKGAICNRLRSGGRVIIEGCMIDAALERLCKVADCRIYVMQISDPESFGDIEWVTKYDVLYGDQSADELIAKLDERREGLAMRLSELFGDDESGYIGTSGLERELIYYHKKFRPHDSANIIIKMKV